MGSGAPWAVGGGLWAQEPSCGRGCLWDCTAATGGVRGHRVASGRCGSAGQLAPHSGAGEAASGPRPVSTKTLNASRIRKVQPSSREARVLSETFP